MTRLRPGMRVSLNPGLIRQAGSLARSGHYYLHSWVSPYIWFGQKECRKNRKAGGNDIWDSNGFKRTLVIFILRFAPAITRVYRDSHPLARHFSNNYSV